MNREKIIEMAREAGLEVDGEYFSDDIYRAVLVRFFHMAQAAMIEQGWRQCAKDQRTTQFCGMVEQVVQEEREACAKLCLETEPFYGVMFANAIKERGQQ